MKFIVLGENSRRADIPAVMAKLCHFACSWRKSLQLTKRLRPNKWREEMYAHNLKTVELYSRTENYTAKRKMNFFELISFLIAHSLLLAFFSETISISYLFCPILFLLLFSSFYSLVPGACLNVNQLLH